MKVKVKLDIQLAADLPTNLQMALYRITQEALNNISKHAAATQVSVRLQVDETRVKLQIKDNGQGFDLLNIPEGHYGVNIMRERAEAVGAVLHVSSAPNQGTVISVYTRLAAYSA